MTFLLIVLIATAAAALSIDSLPDDAIEAIGHRVLDSALLMPLAMISGRIRHVIYTRHRVRALLLDWNAPDSELPRRIRHFLHCTDPNRTSLYYLRLGITHQEAIGVYDSLVNCNEIETRVKIELLSELISEMKIFSDLVSAVNINKMPYELISELPDLNLELDHGIPVQILHTIHRLADHYNIINASTIPDNIVYRVRARYPPPFNRIFPYNHEIAQSLLTAFPEQRPLQSQAVVLALLRYGIRFGQDKFIFWDSVGDPSQIFPLLRPCPRSPFWILFCYLGRMDQAERLMRTGAFVSAVRQNAAESVHYLSTLISFQEKSIKKIWAVIMTQPFFEQLLNCPDPDGKTLLKTAFKYRCLDTITMLLSHPNINLPTATNLLDHFLDQDINLIHRLLRLTALMMEVIKAEIPTLVRLLISAVIEYDQVDVLQCVLNVPFAADIVNHHIDDDKITLLQYTINKQSAPGCVAVMLDVLGISDAVYCPENQPY